ncbi:MAG TPA: RluA family pseudouridine synthase [Acidimicrobiales bacterium]|nr:RluA family pseudouridine synthase [Acidimicrobiales bacterium]
MTRRVEVVPAALAGERLDRVVALVGDVSRADAAALLAAGRVAVDGAVARKPSLRLAEGVEVEVQLEDGPAGPVVAPDPDVVVPVVREDPAFLVVDKPAGLVVHPGAGHPGGTLAAGLLARYPELAGVGEPDRPGLVHRLDRDTSGLLVVARTPEAHADLVGQLQARTVERRYLALVDGHPEAPQGVVDAPIGRSPRRPTLMEVRADGREARTRYEVRETFAEPAPVALVRCRLETGRTHQIRVHLKAIGHPVVGDDRYLGATRVVSCPRTFLHAERLAFRHPVTGAAVEVASDLAPDLAAVLAGLRAGARHPA